MQLLEDLDIVAEYEEYEEGSDKSYWDKPYPCWITFNAETKELSIKFEYEQDNDKPNTYITFYGIQDPMNPSEFELVSNKPDIDNATIWLESSFDGEFWYFDGFIDEEPYTENINGILVEKQERRAIFINQIDSWEKGY